MRRETRPFVWIAVLAVLAGLGLSTPVTASGNEFTDTLSIVKDNESLSPAELSVRLSESTPLEAGGTVLLGRSDVFADSLASGVLQGKSSLLLVPPQGPIPERVTLELQRLNPSRVLLLGGPSAIGEVVEQSLSGTYQVERRAGVSRIETAVAIARLDAPQAQSAILVRGFPAPGGDDTQAFADALGAGGLSAKMGWPVLLTQTETLTGSTRDYLASSSITQVYVVGGTAAISDQVTTQLQQMNISSVRVAGATRAETALEIAKLSGDNSAADVARVMLVDAQDPQAWAGGFASAAHSAFFDAPIVLSSGDVVPPETSAFLSGGASFAVNPNDVSAPVLTCVTLARACETGRQALGLPAAAIVTLDPALATTLVPGQSVSITVQFSSSGFAQDGPGEDEVLVAGTCLDQSVTVPATQEPFTVTTSTSLPSPCTLTVSLLLSNGSTQTSTAVYPGGIIAGTVRNAIDGQPIPGATVTLSGAPPVEAASDGTFSIADLASGDYKLTATADGFQQSAAVPVAVAAASTSTVDVLLSPMLTPGSLRVVLTWDEEPQDLDSHLWLPASQPYHIYFAGGGTLDSCPNAQLDIDDVTSFGPETITIGQSYPGVYRYAVNLFSGAETLSQSNGVVQVYDGNGELATFNVPLNGTAEQVWWHVFDVDVAAGVVMPVNRLLQTESEVAPYPDQFSCA